MKMRGSLKLYRIEFELWKKMTDPELRIFQLLKAQAGWDKRHKENYGRVKCTLRELKEYLPEKGSSIAKLSAVLKSLEHKRFIKRIKDGEILVENFWVYQLPLQHAEQCIQLLEQGIQPSENDFQNLETDWSKFIEQGRKKLACNFTSIRGP